MISIETVMEKRIAKTQENTAWLPSSIPGPKPRLLRTKHSVGSTLATRYSREVSSTSRHSDLDFDSGKSFLLL